MGESNGHAEIALEKAKEVLSGVYANLEKYALDMEDYDLIMATNAAELCLPFVDVSEARRNMRGMRSVSREIEKVARMMRSRAAAAVNGPEAKEESVSYEMGRKASAWKLAEEKAVRFRRVRREYGYDKESHDDWEQAQAQELGLGHERATNRVWKRTLEVNDEIPWSLLNLGSVRMARDEHWWMEKDYWEHTAQWGDERPRTQAWWASILEWEKRSKSRLDAIDTFKKMCVDLMQELEIIDGSSAARESNIRNALYATYEADRCHLLVDYIFHAKVAMHLGDERLFVWCCNSALDLVGQILRSNRVKQGAPMCYGINPTDAKHYF